MIGLVSSHGVSALLRHDSSDEILAQELNVPREGREDETYMNTSYLDEDRDQQMQRQREERRRRRR